MDIDDIIEAVQSIAFRLECESHSLQWYVFGSYAKDKNRAKDLDILILYSSVESAKAARERLNKLSLLFPLDLLFMTKEEELELNFIDMQKANKIYPSNVTKGRRLD